jgi:hypothetical protein
MGRYGRFNLLDRDPENESDEDEHEKRGRPPFVPTDEQRELVKQMAISKHPPEAMAAMILWPDTKKPISVRTLYNKFEREIFESRVRANNIAVGKLFQSVLSGSVAAQIFWAKCQLGWRETVHVEATGKDGAPLQGPVSGVLVVPGVMNADEWARMAEATQDELMQKAQTLINREVIDIDSQAA